MELRRGESAVSHLKEKNHELERHIQKLLAEVEGMKSSRKRRAQQESPVLVLEN